MVRYMPMRNKGEIFNGRCGRRTCSLVEGEVDSLPVAQEHEVAVAEELGVSLLEGQSWEAVDNRSDRIGEAEDEQKGKTKEEENQRTHHASPSSLSLSLKSYFLLVE